MATQNLPSLRVGGTANWQDVGPDPIAHPEYYQGIIARRFMAWLLDAAIVLVAMAGVLFLLAMTKLITLGLMALPVWLGFLIVPFLYYTIFLGGPNAATPGMRVIGLEMVTARDGRPDFGQALLRTIVHYASVVTLSPLILVVMLCNDRRRAAHDYLSGTTIVNRLSATAADTPDRHTPPAKR